METPETIEHLYNEALKAWRAQNDLPEDEVNRITEKIKKNLETEAFYDVEDFDKYEDFSFEKYKDNLKVEIGRFITEPDISYEAIVTDSDGNSFTATPEYNFDSLDSCDYFSWSFSNDTFFGIEDPDCDWGLMWSCFEPIARYFSEKKEFLAYISAKGLKAPEDF